MLLRKIKISIVNLAMKSPIFKTMPTFTSSLNLMPHMIAELL